MEIQNKIEQLTIEQIKNNLISLKPEISHTIDSMTQEQIRKQYQQIYNNCQFNAEKIDNINYLDMDQIIDKEMQNEDKKIKFEQDDDEATTYVKHKRLNPELIRQQLMFNLPEMKQQLKKLDENEIQEIYHQLCKESHHQPTPELIQMIETIIFSYPTMKDKIINCTQTQIHRLYDSCKGHKAYKQNPIITIPSSSVRQNKSVVNVKDKKIMSPALVPIIRKSPKPGYNNFSTYDRKQPQELTQIIAPTVDSKRQKKNQFSFKQNIHHVADQDTNINFNTSGSNRMHYENFAHVQNNNNGTQFYQMSHKNANKNVKAKTYIMIHTQYDNGQKKGDKPLFDNCNCHCCKNNTIQNMFKQIIHKIESSNRR